MFSEAENIDRINLIRFRREIQTELKSIASHKLKEAAVKYEESILQETFFFSDLKDTVCYFIWYRFFKGCNQADGLLYAYDAVCRELVRRSLVKGLDD